MNTADKIWISAMQLGGKAGCHQMPERSFFLCGRQFPVCARCSGVLLGQAAAMLLGKRLDGGFGFWKCAGFLLTMLTDHAAQTLGKGSTNARRLITGTLAGLAVGRAYFALLRRICRAVFGKDG